MVRHSDCDMYIQQNKEIFLAEYSDFDLVRIRDVVGGGGPGRLLLVVLEIFEFS